MSEQLKQMTPGIKIGERFEYFNIGNVTIQTLAKNNIIPNKDYGKYNIKRPDGLLVDRSNKKDPRVIAVIEYKSGEKFQKEKDITDAVQQCNNYCQVLGAIFGIATDTNISVWINPNQENKNNEYKDDFEQNRSYEFIRDEEKQKLSNNFYLHLQKENCENEEKLKDEVRETFKITKRILDSDIGKNNSDLKDTIFVDPTGLAKSIWQDIYVATKQEPLKCLYNVVELFIFKFLSDLGVLEKRYSFYYLIQMIKDGETDDEILKHYADTIRLKIKNELFIKDLIDGTTIINGTVFVNEKDEPVFQYSTVFKKSLEKYNNFGNLTNVDKNFKTKLYETFLKRGSGVKGMGQFFTPRKVIKAMVDMAKVENLKDGMSVCDPFCGVGGFPLEVMAKRNNKDFIIQNGKILENIRYFGFDKGSEEKDSERTIILAKANMLIYLSELIKEYPKMTHEFSNLFNKTFKLKKTILGTLEDISETQYDLILTNPPYLVGGSSNLKEEIENDGNKKDFYQVSSSGTESLCLEWIIKKLKKGGRAFIILPSGIFDRGTEKKLRNFILKECFINGIISLPSKTFFTTSQKTYILIITKKDNKDQSQTKPVFTYFVSDIGEKLDVNRFDTGTSNLENAKNLFRIFDGNEEYFTINDERCRIIPAEKFQNENKRIIEKRLPKEEKINLGIDKEISEMSFMEYKSIVNDSSESFENEVKKLSNLNNLIIKYKKFSIKELFIIKKGKAEYTKSYINDNQGQYPVYSSQTTNDGIIGKIKTFDFDEECLTWTTDGTYVGTVFHRNNKFSMTTHCGGLFLKKEFIGKIDFEYLKIILNKELPKHKEGEGSNKRLGTNKIQNVEVNIPIKNDGNFDIENQTKIAEYYNNIIIFKTNIEIIFNDLVDNDLTF